MRMIYAIGLSLLTLSAPVFALNGCVNSPENPTLILGLIGGAAATVPWIRTKLAAKASACNPVVIGERLRRKT